MPRLLLAVAMAGVVVLALLVGQRAVPRRGDEDVHAARSPLARGEADDEVSAAGADTSIARRGEPGAAAFAKGVRRPRSLRGSRTDGGLLIDAAGHFVPTIDARRLFDYFLSASGESSIEALRARIVAEIERLLDGAAAREAIALLDHYLTYRERVRARAAEEAAGDAGQGGLEARLAELIALRREVLGLDVAEAFFADEEAKARHALDARRIAMDPSLEPEERMARLQALDAGLPPEVRESRAAAALAASLQHAEAELRARGGDGVDLQAVRERMVGTEAAERLAALDRARADWRARVDAFRAERARLEQDPSLSPAARAAAIEQLSDASFSATERRRIQALDRIEGK